MTQMLCIMLYNSQDQVHQIVINELNKLHNIKTKQENNLIRQKKSMELSQLQNMVQSTKKQLKVQLEYALFTKNNQKALQIIQKVINIDPQSSQIHKTKAFALFNLRRFAQAIKTAQTSLSMGQKSLELQNLIIQCHIQLNNLQQAQKTIQKTLGTNHALRHFIELTQTIDKINNHELYKLPETEERILNDMKQWLYPKGAVYDKVKVVTQKKGYRGAIATKSIQKDQVIVFIPKSQLITLELAKQNPISKQVIKKQIQLLSPKHSFISIFLLEQKASGQSKFKPYLDILPTDHSCFPINYSTEQLMELIGSTFLYQIKEKVIDLKKDYDAICFASPEFYKKYSFQDFCWARMMVGSRVFGVFIDKVKTQILAPFADMLNHKVPKQTVWNYSEEKQGFFIQSLKDIFIGEQLFDSYGKKCNSRFLLNYGFVLETNDRNQICIKVDFDEKDPLLTKKMDMLRLEKDSVLSRIFRITKRIEENSFFELMGFLRFKNIEKMETLTILEKISNIQKLNQPYNPSRSPPTTMQIELKIWAQLRNLCLAALNEYTSTLQQDEQRLKKQNNLSENIRNILILKIGQKRLYHYYSDMAESVLEILSKGYLQARETAQKQVQKDYCRYIEKILNLMPHQKNALLKKGLKESTQDLMAQNSSLIEDLDQDDQISREY